MTAVRVVAAGRLQPRRRPDPEPAVDPAAVVEVGRPGAPADHPHTDPGDGRTECERCGKYVWPVIHSCKGIPVTARARARREARDA